MATNIRKYTKLLPLSIRRLGRYWDKARDSIPISDMAYAQRRFLKTFGYELNLNNPQSFSEKIQWLKLYARDPLLTKLSDKFLVREYVKEKVGENILNPLIAVYSRPEDINFDKLPNSFVLKANHGSGWNIICKDKRSFDKELCLHTLGGWLKENYYHKGREWNYKHIRPMIICESYLGHNLPDYKFFCFQGKVKLIQVDIDRFAKHVRNLYDVRWNLQPATLYYPSANKRFPKPSNLNSMIKIAEKLAVSLKFVRVDLYSLNESVVFGELTLFPGNGYEPFNPIEFDHRLGKYLNL